MLKLIIAIAYDPPDPVETGLFISKVSMTDFEIAGLDISGHFEEAYRAWHLRPSSYLLLQLGFFTILGERILECHVASCATLDESTCVRFEFLLDTVSIPAFIVKKSMRVPIPSHNSHKQPKHVDDSQINGQTHF